MACLEALKGGCTTLCEFFNTNQDPELADVCVQVMRPTGIRGVLARTFQDYGDEFGTPECYIEPVDAAIAEVDRLRGGYDDGDMPSVWTGSHPTRAAMPKRRMPTVIRSRCTTIPKSLLGRAWSLAYGNPFVVY